MRGRMDFKRDYLEWFSNNMKATDLSQNMVRLTVPFLDFNNDYTEIFVQKQGNSYMLTDYGETISNLELSNYIPTEKPQALSEILSYYGVRLDGNALSIECSKADFGSKANALIQCILRIGFFFKDGAADGI